MIHVLKWSDIAKLAGEVQAGLDEGYDLEEALRDSINLLPRITVQPDCKYTECDYGMGLAGRARCSNGDPANRDCPGFTKEFSENGE